MPLRAVVISFDHLHAGYLGCYGNEWVETPHLDRFASGAVVFDTHLAENLDPRAQNHAWWTGRHQAVCDLDRQPDEPSLVERLSESGVRTWLFAESDGREAPQVAPRFEDVVTVRGEDGLDVEERRTPFARVVQRLIEQLQEIVADEKPSLLWVKSRGVPNPWLPPQEFADLYLDEFGLSGEGGAVESSDETEEEVSDEPSDPFEEPEEVWSLESGHSVDLKYAKALYAAYVTWLDRWFGQLLHELAKVPGADELLVIVTGASGQPLGEHGELDVRPDLLRAEVIHTPLIVRLPDRAHDATRRPAITQSIDLFPTLFDWFGVALRGNGPAAEASSRIDGQSLLPLIRQERDELRAFALIGNADEWGIRTNGFLLVHRHAADQSEPGEANLLFEKPHDRWDQSDVSSQYPQVVEDLQARLLAERERLKR